MFRNLIFDWSGTLVDDLGPVIEATNAVMDHYALPRFDRVRFRHQFRLPYREFYHDLLPNIPLEELEARFRSAFDTALTPVTVLPHAREKLAWCAASGLRVFVLTSMDTTAFERQLDDLDLRRFFEATYSGVADKRERIHSILETHRLDPAETAFVGDMIHDVETARHGGIASIAVLTGYTLPEILAASQPDLTVANLDALQKLLDKPSDPECRCKPLTPSRSAACA
jgi:phosphoglycolate phosphatase